MFSSFVLTVLSSGLFFVFNFAIAKILGAKVYGEIAFYVSFIQILLLFVGLNYPALYMGNRITRNDKDTLSLFFSYETLLFALSIFPAYFILHYFIQNNEIVFLVLFISYTMTLVGTIGLEYNARKNVSTSILVSILVPRVLLMLFYFVAIFIGVATPLTYLYIYLFSSMIVVIFFLYKFHPKIYFKKEFISRAWKFYLLGAIGESFTYIAQIAEKEYGGYEELASMAIGMLAVTGLSIIGSILIKYALPKIHEAWSEKDIKKIGILYKTHTFLSSMINLIILIFVLFYIKTFSQLLGPGYQSLPFIFYILSVGYFFDLMTGISGTVLRATEHEHLEIYNEILRLISGVISIILLKNYEHGIVYALTISIIVYNSFKYFQIYRLFGILPINGRHLKVLILTVLSYTLLLSFSLWFNADSLKLFYGIVISAFFAIAVYRILKKEIQLEIYV